MSRLILSLFPGIGLLDRAFEQAGFCVVRGPDLLWGGDIRRFHPPRNLFWGVIGGPPCQDFSAARRSPPTGYGVEMLAEFVRCLIEIHPDWYLMENVPRVPGIRLANYLLQRFELDQGWYEPVSRLRHFQYGCWNHRRLLSPPKFKKLTGCVPGAMASDDRSSQTLAELQGLPDDFVLPGFTEAGRREAIGNGVPLVLGRVLARLVCEAWELPCDLAAASGVTDQVDKIDRADRIDRASRCACGCGRILAGREKYASPACRKRAQRRRAAGLDMDA
jgi:DNA (cytosine-5)-methyltransferase 1